MFLCVKLTRGQLYWLVVCQLDTAGVITEKGASVGQMPPQHPDVRHLVISDQEGRYPCGLCHLWAGSPGFYKSAG